MQNKAINIVLLVISQGVNIILTFLFTPYLVRALPKDIYGSYSQTIFLAELASTLTSFAIMQIAMMVFSNKEKKLADSIKTIVMAAAFTGGIGVLLCFLFSFIAPGLFSNELLGTLLQYYSIGILANKLNLILNQALIRVDKTKAILILSILSNFAKLSLGVAAIHYYNSITLLLLIYAIEPIVSSLIQLYILYRAGYLNGKFDNLIIKEMIKVALPLYFVEILGASYTYTAGIIISMNLREEQYAIYKNGSVELPVIGTIYGTVSLIFMSDLLSHIQDNNFKKVAEIKNKIITSTAVIVFPIAIFFAIFSKEFITIYLSEKYIESYTVFIVFCLALLIRFQNYTDVLILMKKSKYVLYSFATFIILNISLNLILIKPLGILGCAIATILSTYFLAFMQLHITIKKLQVNYTTYINYKALLKIILISGFYIGVIKIISLNIIHSPLYSFVISGMFSIPVLILYFIKTKLIDITPFESFFNKIPYLGQKLFAFLK